MKKLKWEYIWAWLAIGFMVGVAIAGVGYAVYTIDLNPQVHVITVDGVQWECEVVR